MFDAAPPFTTPSGKPPILVTGAPRSGTTWLGNVLTLAPGTGNVHEPFNRDYPHPGICRAGLTHFLYLTEADDARYLAPLGDTLSWRYSVRAQLRATRSPKALARFARDYAYFQKMRRQRAQTILKDPLALFAAEWIGQRFGARTVVTIRHPAGFVASMRAAKYIMNFSAFQRQPRLMAERLAPFAAEIAAAAPHPSPSIEANALLWRILHHHIDRLRTEHPDWIFVRHEDLSHDPAAEFPAIFARLGLDFTPEVAAGLAQFTAGGLRGRLSIFGNRRRTVRSSQASVETFRKRLSAAEIARIRELTDPLWRRFYDESDW